MGIYESGTNASVPRWQSPSQRPDVKGQFVSEHRSSSFIIQRPDGRKKKKKKKNYKDTHSHLDDSVPVRWSAMNAWKDTGNPVLYHTQKRKRKWDLHQSIKARAQAGESPVEMAAADNATPVIITRGLLSLFSTGKHIHMMCLTEQRSSVSPSWAHTYFRWMQPVRPIRTQLWQKAVFFLRFSYHVM